MQISKQNLIRLKLTLAMNLRNNIRIKLSYRISSIEQEAIELNRQSALHTTAPTLLTELSDGYISKATKVQYSS
jgi:hypothetical protein